MSSFSILKQITKMKAFTVNSKKNVQKFKIRQQI